jgi:hypothetical protein
VISFFTRYFARRRLRPVVSALPRRLAKGWGRREHYTLLQARRAISDLKFNKAVEPYALAVACAAQDLQAVPISADEHHRLRAELSDLFDLPRNFAMKDLLKKRWGSHSPVEYDVVNNDTGPEHR